MNWLVGCTLTGDEIDARSWGLERGYEVYLPMAASVVRVKRSRAPRTMRRPAFPGYVFIRYTPECGQFTDDRSSGVYAFLRVRMDDVYGLALVPQEIIDGLKAREAAGDFSDTSGAVVVPEIEVGQEAYVLMGGRKVRGVVARRLKSGRIRLTGGDLWAPVEVSASELYA